MPGKKNIIAGVVFFFIACLIISFSGFSPMLFPAQEDHVPGKYDFGGVVNSYLLKQPFTPGNDFLTGVDILLANSPPVSGIDNIILITDSSNNILTTVKFSSESIISPGYQSFRFPKELNVLKGKKYFLILYSANGDPNNSIHVGMLPSKKFSPLTVVPFQNNDVPNSLKIRGQPYDKSLCFRTYESGFKSFSVWQLPFYVLSLVIAFVIIFYRQVRTMLLKVKISPSGIYLPLGLIGGILLVFLTPPLQIPDENYHLYRSYQISELNIFQHDQTVPKSLILLSDTLKRMNFQIFEKTSYDELKSLTKVKLEPGVRNNIPLPGYFLPYFPQALGIGIGRMFNASPVSLVYFGRILNLFFSILFVFLAIRAAPFFKWVFFLLGLMPMTMYLFSSLSKDGITISLSFLLIATFLKYAFDREKKIETTDLILLILLACCVALTRYIYLIILVLYFFIPIVKLGTLKKYLLVFCILLVSVFLTLQIPKLGALFKPSVSHSTEAKTQASTLQNTAEKTKAYDQTQAAEGANAPEQMKFIFHNPVQYVKIVYNTVFIYLRKAYLDSFVGTLGWMDRPMPLWLINIYYLILFITAFFFADENSRSGIKNWLLLVFIFIGGIFLVETGQYISWTAVGQQYVEGVQGRYYIPLAPAFFLVFYNNFIYKYLKILLNPRKAKPVKQKQKGKLKAVPEIQSDTPVIFTTFFHIFILCFSVVSILCTLYTVLANYYVI